MNILMVFAIFNLVVVIAAPIFGGVFIVRGLIGYGMWILVALVGKEYYKRLRVDAVIKTYEAAIGMLIAFISFATTIHFPFGIVIGALICAGLVVGHKAQIKHFRSESREAA